MPDSATQNRLSHLTDTAQRRLLADLGVGDGRSVSSARFAVVIASAGRRSVLEAALAHLDLVRPAGTKVVVSVPDAGSAPAAVPEGVVVLIGTRGASAQRNAALDALSPEYEFVGFLDDDTLVHPDWFGASVRAFDLDPDVIAVTGTLIADGVQSGEIAAADAERMLEHAVSMPFGGGIETYSLYGCNFVVRSSILARERFDDRLPLYSWLEDEDLSRRLARHGRLVTVPAARCVHLGARSGGRTDHLRLGYSQVANPYYLWRKNSVTSTRLLSEVGRRIVGNALRSFRGTDREGRRRRLRGNVIAGADILRGRSNPGRILSLAKG